VFNRLRASGYLAPIALLDGTSMVAPCIVFLVMLLSGPDPKLRRLSLLAGIFVVHAACGLLILFGPQSVFEVINA
jgi:hypothetical protein